MSHIPVDVWQRVEVLLDTALSYPSDERTAYLQQACNEDPSIRTLLLELWAAGKEADKALEEQVPVAIQQAIDQISFDDILDPSLAKGSRLGEYLILREIGQGGVGVVYEAERADGHFDQKVALKIIKRGMDTENVLKRFLAERQILAGLQHANIAHLMDGGMSPDGRPYLVMEFVDGAPITTFCDTHQLSIKERLALFARVCQSVSYAHRSLVVHRDLKPSNILVTEEQAIKLLDFGIAKVLASPEQHASGAATTIAAHRMMTPEYAAPEQVFGQTITTATDVYALGIILYELLCGTRPYSFPSRDLATIERTIREAEPKLPSKIIGKGNPESALTPEDRDAIGQQRKSTHERLSNELKGDLDTIVLKALRREPDRRYESVSAFAADIDNYLTGRPVEARPATLAYRTRKLYQRNKAGFAGAALVMLAILFSLFSTIRQNRLILAERDIAQNEATKSERVTEFLMAVFETTDPEIAQGDTLTAYDILERGAERLESDLEEEPEVLGDMMTVIGRMYLNLGSYDGAHTWLKNAFDHRTSLFQEERHPDMYEATYHYATALFELGQHGEAEKLLLQSLDPPPDLDDAAIKDRVSQIYNSLGLVLHADGRPEESKEAHETALAYQLELYGEDEPGVAIYMLHLGNILDELSEYDRANELFQDALELYRNNPEGNSITMGSTLHSFAGTLNSQGNYEEAERYYREAISHLSKYLGPDHAEIYDIKSDLASFLGEIGRYPESESLHIAILEFETNTYGEAHPHVIMTSNNLGSLYVLTGEHDKAEAMLGKALELNKKTYGAESTHYINSLSNLGVLLYFRGKYLEAAQHFSTALEMDKIVYGTDHPYVATRSHNLSSALYEMGRYEEAVPIAESGLAIRKEKLEPEHPEIGLSLTQLGKILVKLKKFNEAESLLNEGADVFRNASLTDHPYFSSTHLAFAQLYLATNRSDMALTSAEEGVRIRKAAVGETHWLVGEGVTVLGKVYLERGDRAKAKELFKEGYDILLGSVGDTHKYTQEASALLSSM